MKVNFGWARGGKRKNGLDADEYLNASGAKRRESGNRAGPHGHSVARVGQHPLGVGDILSGLQVTVVVGHGHVVLVGHLVVGLWLILLLATFALRVGKVALRVGKVLGVPVLHIAGPRRRRCVDVERRPRRVTEHGGAFIVRGILVRVCTSSHGGGVLGKSGFIASRSLAEAGLQVLHVAHGSGGQLLADVHPSPNARVDKRRDDGFHFSEAGDDVVVKDVVLLLGLLELALVVAGLTGVGGGMDEAFDLFLAAHDFLLGADALADVAEDLGEVCVEELGDRFLDLLAKSLDVGVAGLSGGLVNGIGENLADMGGGRVEEGHGVGKGFGGADRGGKGGSELPGVLEE
mmetsp:Transcript_14544/g.35993  ORF Transcript_14544/g.35993 Transcript_14544/m.35993 type:complete len:347 (+) Transcript_14544:1205-2245(+)